MTEQQTTGAMPKFCYHCGKPASFGAAVCWNCSQPLVPPAIPLNEPTAVAMDETADSPQRPGAFSLPPSGGPTVPPPPPPPAAKPQSDWRKYAGVLAIGGAMLWKYKFALYIALRSLSLFGR